MVPQHLEVSSRRGIRQRRQCVREATHDKLAIFSYMSHLLGTVVNLDRLGEVKAGETRIRGG